MRVVGVSKGWSPPSESVLSSVVALDCGGCWVAMLWLSRGKSLDEKRGIGGSRRREWSCWSVGSTRGVFPRRRRDVYSDVRSAE